MNNKEKKWDNFLKLLLLFAFVYFGLHAIAAFAQTPIPSPTQPIIQCWSNGLGTIQCIQL